MIETVRARGPVLLAALILASACARGEDRTAPAPSFQKDVGPLFQAKCQRCHGEKTRKADLDLSTPVNILKGGESGKVIVPGKPDESLLYEKVHSGMMPPGKKDRLSDAEVALIRRWIEAGARFESDDAKQETLTQ